ncbi:hypothetical protein LT679_04185 [Mucilaginibacter roseus]|uniref:Transposase zinc-ribbon domain-containing protein n=1 Tax=Mucilaginibacter roseus TaxID=1528868 RepID=A0ABS8TY62_9SPHI|nr:hypothetical protein [Mucilaginibacter roseus]MCD8739791.1 hypothetical protein [Mucilaginibacter roseus]
MDTTRFRDENKGLSEFQTRVSVECPMCGRQAYATVSYETKVARLICAQCGYNKTDDITSKQFKAITFIKAAHGYFDARLWYQHPFKDDVFGLIMMNICNIWKIILAPNSGSTTIVQVSH